MRYLTGNIEKRLEEERKMVFVSGPRQVGKTTLAKHLLKTVHAESGYFNWDIHSQRRNIMREPEDFWRAAFLDSQVSGASKPRIVLDEIHKYARWKRFLKGLADATVQDLDIIVTGSGRLDIYQRGGDSLFGRYSLFHLHPFTVGELMNPGRNAPRPPDRFWPELAAGRISSAARDALQAIETYSGFPEPLFASSRQRWRRWQSEHKKLVIREDLRDLTRIRDLGMIEALVELLPDRVGAPLSINSIREDLAVSFGALKNWLQTLECLYYLFTIRPYTARLNRSLRQEGKVYLLDPTEIDPPGPRFENLVALHLKKLVDFWNDLGYGSFMLHYLRDREKREVDFLISEAKRPFLLVEAKLSGAEISSSLSYFQEKLSPVRAVQVVRETLHQGLVAPKQNLYIAPAALFLALI